MVLIFKLNSFQPHLPCLRKQSLKRDLKNDLYMCSLSGGLDLAGEEISIPLPS